MAHVSSSEPSGGNLLATHTARCLANDPARCSVSQTAHPLRPPALHPQARACCVTSSTWTGAPPRTARRRLWCTAECAASLTG
jgi:hypothetical protein